MIDMRTVLLFLAAFLASGVEVVEMMTILLGVGMTSGWYSTLLGAATGLAALGMIVAILGPALAVIPLGRSGPLWASCSCSSVCSG